MDAIRILDIDLDFFQYGIILDSLFAEGTTRPTLDDVQPWEEEKVKQFLLENLNLKNMAPGAIFCTHEKVFGALQQIRSENPDSEIEVVHVDAHADVGNSHSVEAIFEEFIWLPVEDRISVDCVPPKLSQGNFLAFAISSKLISKLVYVYHSDRDPDICPAFFKNCDRSSDELQMKKLSPGSIGNGSDIYKLLPEAKVIESVEYLEYECTKYTDTGEYDFIFLTISPRYTVPETEEIIGLISPYIAINDKFDNA